MEHFKPYPEQLFITGYQFFSNQFTDKSVEEKLILYKKHILAANNYDKFDCFLMHYLMQINGTFQTVPRTIVYHRTPIIFF